MYPIIDAQISLADALKSHSHQKIADWIGVTRPAVYQMESNGRDIYLKKIKGVWHYSELKRWRRGTT